MIAARPCVLLLSISLLAPSSVFAVDDATLGRAKELYRNASYDEALALFDELAAAPGPLAERNEANAYRLFCLIALDRKADAHRAIEAMVTADPFYQLPGDQAPPRVRTLFNEVRRAALPAIVQRAYADAKAAFDRQDAQSAARFEHVLKLLSDPDAAAVPALADLRTVATAFRDLSTAVAARTAPPPPAPAASSAPSARARAAAVTVYRDGDVGVVPPVAINQALPRWIRPSGLPAGQWVWEGTLEIAINEAGDVTAATLTKSVHPTYDSQLTRAAMSWKYQPARKDGSAVRYVKAMAIRLGAGN